MNSTHIPKVLLLTLVLSPHQCAQVAKLAAKEHLGATKEQAQGTISSRLLLSLGIFSDRRELVRMLMCREQAEHFLELLNGKLQLNKPGHGIAYLTEVLACAGTHHGEIALKETTQKDMEDQMYRKITVIVDRGNAEEVMEAAREAGAKGGTITHGRGSTGRDSQKIFGIEIEEEKEIIHILTPTAITKAVVDAILEKAQLDEPGRGILYVEAVLETRGMFENAPK